MNYSSALFFFVVLCHCQTRKDIFKQQSSPRYWFGDHTLLDCCLKIKSNMSQTNKSYRKLFAMLNSDDDLITNQLISKIKEEYEIHHRTNFKDIEYNLLQIKGIKCPKCGSKNYVSNGHMKNGTQRYKCECGKVFGASSKSLFYGTKVNIKAWYSFIEGIVAETSTKAACIKAKISTTTGYYWMQKIFKVLKSFQESIFLNGNIYLDETYVGIEQSKEKKGRGGYKLVGLSRNKICIVLMNDGTHVVAIKCGFGKPNASRLFNTCHSHIKPKSILIHDEELSHSKLIRELELTSHAYKASGRKTKQASMKELQPINDECRKLKYFLSKHKGINKDNIQDYLNLYSFITNCKMKDENLYFASNLLLKLLFLSDETIKFRDVIN